MSYIEEEILQRKDTELVYDKLFFNRIFKRTERLIQATFYVVDRVDVTHAVPGEKDIIIRDIERVSVNIIDKLTRLLSIEQGVIRRPFTELGSELLHLSTLISVLAARELIKESYGLLISHEVQALLSELSDLKQKGSERAPRREIRQNARRVTDAGSAVQVHSGYEGELIGDVPRSASTSRKDRIKEILREKGQVSIKDISDVIKDVSEKSIQRDLNDMISLSEVVRHGERRWSTYSLQS